MSKSTVLRAAGILMGVVLIGLLLAPLLWFDPLAVAPSGGEGYEALREWERLHRDGADHTRRKQLEATFGVIRSHLGRLYYTAADPDGTCWAISVDPPDTRPRKVDDRSWCRR